MNRNMYGCTPCPECGSEYRWVTSPAHPVNPNVIYCDGCDHVEPIDPATLAAIDGLDEEQEDPS